MKRVAIFISGGGSNMLSLVLSMRGDHPARPCLVLSNQADAGGLEKAAELGIPTEVVDHLPYGRDRVSFETELQDVVTRYSPDIICLAGFMRVLTEGFTSHWDGRMLNIHPSLLPKYKGLRTHQRALDAGDKEAGCTVHEVTAKLDDGPILGQARITVGPEDTAGALASRVLVQEHVLYPAVLKRFAGGDKRPLYLP